MARNTRCQFYFFLLLITLYMRFIKCDYTVNQTGEIAIASHINEIIKAEIKKTKGKPNLKLTNVIKFPRHCILHIAVDYNSTINTKPVYYIQRKFYSHLHLYKNNVFLMNLPYKHDSDIAGIAVNRQVMLMLSADSIDWVDYKHKKIFKLTLKPRNHITQDIKGMHFMEIISAKNLNEYYVYAFDLDKNYILHVRHIKKNKELDILEIIDNFNGKNIGVISGMTTTNRALYVSELSKVVKYDLYETNKSERIQVIYNFQDYLIMNLHGYSIYDKEKNDFVDLLLIKTVKKVDRKDDYQYYKEPLVFLLKIEENVNKSSSLARKPKKSISVKLYNIFDLFSNDINVEYFFINNMYFYFDDELEKDYKLEYENEASNSKALLSTKKKSKSKYHSRLYIKIFWSNVYNCSFYKGIISREKIREIDSNYKNYVKQNMNRLPLVDARRYISGAPSATAISHCNINNETIKKICYYDADNNSVNYVHKYMVYNSEFRNNFILDGLSSYMAFDYKTHRGVHILTYPYNNTIFIKSNNWEHKIFLSIPLGIYIDALRSNETYMVFYVVTNDEHKNYVNRCHLDLTNKTHKCYDNFTRDRKNNELFQHVSFVSYLERNNLQSYIYVVSNKRNIYQIIKINEKKYGLRVWKSVSNHDERFGPIATSISYLYVNNAALLRLSKLYPKDNTVQRLVNEMNNNKLYGDHTCKNGSNVANNNCAHGVANKFYYLTSLHTVIYTISKDTYNDEFEETIHFEAKILNENFHSSFNLHNRVVNISNTSTLSYYLTE